MMIMRFCMPTRCRCFVAGAAVLAALITLAPTSGAAELPEGFMPLTQSEAILKKTLVITLNPDLSELAPAERGAAQLLLDVGYLFQNVYENSLHHQARAARESLAGIDRSLGSPPETRYLLELYYLFDGPIARTLDGNYVPIVPVDARVPGRNVYPWGVAKEEIERFIAEHPEERASLLHPRTVVRRVEQDAVDSDLAVLKQYPVLTALHPGLESRLSGMAGQNDEHSFYAVPYSVACANDIMKAYDLLREASSIIAADDIDFARYLEHRAVDLLMDDYEAGDATWVTGSFKHLNAQIGSYEVYDDELYAVKTFFSLSLLVKDSEKSAALQKATEGMQSFEESLPIDAHKRVREEIPVGVYNVIADFGQSRGSNTATILPNESYIVRKFGRTILIRNNIIQNPELFAVKQSSWNAAVDPAHRTDYTAEGDYYRTLWHEIGHYLGPDLDTQGRTLGEALEEDSQILEELKADLVSLFLAPALVDRGYYSTAQERAVYASGIRRVLLKTRPERTETYQTMELMQMNYFLKHGLLAFDAGSGKLKIRYDAYHDVVKSMLGEVLSLQHNGDKAAADAFIDSYRSWDDKLQGALAGSMRATERYRYVMVKYGVVEH
jgi:hypothetical protein